MAIELPTRITQGWIEETAPEQKTLGAGKEFVEALAGRNWTPDDLEKRVKPHLPEKIQRVVGEHKDELEKAKADKAAAREKARAEEAEARQKAAAEKKAAADAAKAAAKAAAPTSNGTTSKDALKELAASK